MLKSGIPGFIVCKIRAFLEFSFVGLDCFLTTRSATSSDVFVKQPEGTHPQLDALFRSAAFGKAIP